MHTAVHVRPRPAIGGHRSTRPGWASGIASEHGGAYDAGRPEPGPASEVSEAPFGLPVLAELPELAGVLDHLVAADRALLDAVTGLADLLAGDRVKTATGVGVEHWLSIVAGLTRMDRRLLLRACRLLGRLPTLDDAVRRHRISFAQLRGLTIALRSAPRQLDDQVDGVLGALLAGLEEFERPDPDVLVRQVADALDELDADDLAAREHGATAGRFLQLQPRLDGTGGRFVGELDAAGLALLDAATSPSASMAGRAGSHGAARADLLLARLVGAGPNGGPLDAAADDSPPTPDSAEAAAAHEWFGALAPPQLLLRMPFDALVDDRLPADLLTTLVGGRLRLTSSAARRLLERAGARLRTIVVDDDGSVLGVGRATRQPPGALTDVLAAIHDTCTGPGCDLPVRSARIDHAVPWWPTRPDQPAGTTDLDNLGPLCDSTNRAKESAGWQVSQTVAGTRTWTHFRSGLATTTLPATWRPPDDPRRHRRRPPGSVPPGHEGSGLLEADRGYESPPTNTESTPGDGLPF